MVGRGRGVTRPHPAGRWEHYVPNAALPLVPPAPFILLSFPRQSRWLEPPVPALSTLRTVLDLIWGGRRSWRLAAFSFSSLNFSWPFTQH